MTGLIIFGAIVLFFVLIGMISATVTLSYNREFAVSLRVLFFRFQLVPKKSKTPNPKKYTRKKYEKMLEKQRIKEEKAEEKKKLKKEKKEAEKAEKEKAKAAGNGEKKSDEGKKKSVADIVDLVSTILEAVKSLFKSFGKHLRVCAVKMNITVASDNAADTAVIYGVVCQSVAYIMEILYNITNFKVKNGDSVSVVPDFTASKSTADIKISFRLRVWHIFAMLFAAAGGFIRGKIKTNKN